MDRAEPHHDKASIIHPSTAGPLGDQSLPINDLLTRLVAPNHGHAAEEQRGQVRWLRPEFSEILRRSGALKLPHAGCDSMGKVLIEIDPHAASGAVVL